MVKPHPSNKAENKMESGGQTAQDMKASDLARTQPLNPAHVASAQK
jgi:hypothetical protein